jgi:hypothetical protein
MIQKLNLEKALGWNVYRVEAAISMLESMKD